MRVAALHDAKRWAIRNARVPACLTRGTALASDQNGLAQVDLVVADGRIESLLPAGMPGLEAETPYLDLGGGIVLPCLVDIHTHLDKGHIWPRTPNPDGTFTGALDATGADRVAHWSAGDVRARMDFGLACAYAHGTSAMRTHIDSIGPQTGISWPVFAQLRDKWRGKVELQAVPLFGINLALDEAHILTVLDQLARAKGQIMGAVTYMDPALQEGLDLLFELAAYKGYDLDFHVDETRDPSAHSLRLIAETAIAHEFQGKILAGHCCSLAMQDPEEAKRTVELVARAGISVVSLPMCNLYLQNRQAGTTPRWRGVTLLHELRAAGVPVMMASDNVRDPFYAYGDLDMLEVFREGTRILHLDHPRGDWIKTIASAPAEHMLLQGFGVLAAGGKADLILTGARDFTELLSRPQSDRRVVRGGRVIDDHVPAYPTLSLGGP